MSGPVEQSDVSGSDLDAGEVSAAAEPSSIVVLEGRTTDVAGTPVTRLLPKRVQRTIGAWCFADLFGGAAPGAVPATMAVGPHPHIGLQTVTWLLEGEILHTDSLGSEQLIRPGQLNLMTSGRGIAHAEQAPARGVGADGLMTLHGLQLWVALPDATRFVAPDFEHYRALPVVEIGAASATVLIGEFGGGQSLARHDTPLVGVDLQLRGSAVLPLDPAYEYGLIVTDGRIEIGAVGDPVVLEPGKLAYLGTGRDEVRVSGEGRAMLLGGEPFESPLVMFWNFVSRSRDEIEQAYLDWQATATGHSDRFGDVVSALGRIDSPRPSWLPGSVA